MQIKVIDLNDEHLYQEWKKLNRDKVYLWDIKDLVLDGKMFEEKFDAYIFLWDDGKGKHESYEVNFVIPYDPIENNVLNIDHTWYGATQKEAIENFKKGIRETFENFKKLCIAGKEVQPYIFDWIDERIK